MCVVYTEKHVWLAFSLGQLQLVVFIILHGIHSVSVFSLNFLSYFFG